MPVSTAGQFPHEQLVSPPSPTTQWEQSHQEQLQIAAPGECDADPGSMHDPRNSTALRQLADLGHEPDPPRWAWAVARLDPKGRLLLPAEARLALGVRPGERTVVRGVCHRVALVLSAEGARALMSVEGRGRLVVPAWLRRGSASPMVVGTRSAPPMVVVAPTSVLDGLGDILSGESR